MAAYTETLDTSFNYPHIDVYKRFYDGVHSSYKIYPHEGYVMYSQSTDVIILPEINPETGEPITEIYYCRMANLSLRYNFDEFDYIAVLESEVPADHIFGGGNNDHEVMGDKEETETE